MEWKRVDSDGVREEEVKGKNIKEEKQRQNDV